MPALLLPKVLRPPCRQWRAQRLLRDPHELRIFGGVQAQKLAVITDLLLGRLVSCSDHAPREATSWQRLSANSELAVAQRRVAADAPHSPVQLGVRHRAGCGGAAPGRPGPPGLGWTPGWKRQRLSRAHRRPGAAAPCDSIFLDKNRRHIGKSRSKQPPKMTQQRRSSRDIHPTRQVAGVSGGGGSLASAVTGRRRRRVGGGTFFCADAMGGSLPGRFRPQYFLTGTGVA
jgi:hypothetical protein